MEVMRRQHGGKKKDWRQRIKEHIRYKRETADNATQEVNLTLEERFEGSPRRLLAEISKNRKGLAARKSLLKTYQEKLTEAEEELKFREEDAIHDVAYLHVYFKQLGIMQYTRDELYSVVDFIAAVGGIIGLCIGFSLVSMTEIWYWFTVRMYNDYRKKKREERKRIGFEDE